MTANTNETTAAAYAYTSLFLDSAVARWTLGGPYQAQHEEAPWTLVQKIPVH